MNSFHELHILVMHEDAIVGAGVAAVLREQPGVSVTLLSSFRGPAPLVPRDVAVVVTDYWKALEIAEGARHDGPRLLIVSGVEREWEICRAIKAGVHGYVLQSCCIDELLQGVWLLGRGSRYICAKAAEGIAEGIMHTQLTSREIEVLQLVALGSCNKAIAGRLEISLGTVKTHVKSILGKLDARSRTEAASIATKRGLVQEALTETSPVDSPRVRPVPRTLVGRSNPRAASVSN